MPEHYEEEMSAIQGIDPVSGNEVPVGSEPEEVRDDIDAKLSKNEFVVPADVVRYFGVAHFENLIKKAKKGWAEMEENGRIGGEEAPPEPTPAEDDLPFTDEELASVDVPDAPVEMNEGGMVTGGFDPSNFGIGFSTFGGGVENRVYTNASGQKRTILFIGGTPIQQIPEGFVPDTAANRRTFEQQAEQAVEEAIEPTENDFDSRAGRGSEEDYGIAQAADYTTMTQEQIERETQLGQKTAGLVGGALAGPLGAKALSRLAANEQRKELENQGFPASEIDAILGEKKGLLDPTGLLDPNSLAGRAVDRLQHDRKARAAQAEFEADTRDYNDPDRTREREQERSTFGNDPEGDPDPYSPDIDTTGFNKGGLVSKKDWKKKRKSRKKIKLATRK